MGQTNEHRLAVAQSQSYVSEDWWDWSVWIAGPQDKLDQIKDVVWRLHPTFTPPAVKITDRSSNFRLSTSGWGTFTLRADITLMDGSEINLRHELELCYPDNTPARL